MITQTFKCNFSVSCLSTRHSSIWITMTAVCHPTYQNLQKLGYDIVIFNGNVLGYAWHIWCKKGTNGKKMSCSLLIGHMKIFKSIDFRTMGLWKWITFILIHTVQLNVTFYHTIHTHRKSTQFPTDCMAPSKIQFPHFNMHPNGSDLHTFSMAV